MEDSPFCPENAPIRAIIPFVHQGSLLFDWEHVVIRLELGNGHSRSVRGDRPAAAVAVAQGVHEAIGLIAQVDGLASIIETSGEGTDFPPAGRLGDDEVSPGTDHGSGRKGVIDPSREAPAGEVDLDAHLVEEFEPFAAFGSPDRIVVDLVEDDDAVGLGGGGKGK